MQQSLAEIYEEWLDFIAKKGSTMKYQIKQQPPPTVTAFRFAGTQSSAAGIVNELQLNDAEILPDYSKGATHVWLWVGLRGRHNSGNVRQRVNNDEYVILDDTTGVISILPEREFSKLFEVAL